MAPAFLVSIGNSKKGIVMKLLLDAGILLARW